MQTVLTYLTLLITGVMLHAQNSVEVTLTHFNSDEGMARVGLYNNPSDFLNKEFKTLETTIQNGVATVTFTDVPDGIYAISSYHDEDNNGQLNMRMGIIPAEDYGCSNNARGFFGPPKWEDAQFEVQNGEVKQLEIKVK